VETGGTFGITGRSGEQGALQYLESTWKLHAQDVLGYVPPFTETNERYVAAKTIEKMLDAGMSVRQIALVWNSGQTKCIKGINRYGVHYDNCAYADQVQRSYDRF